MQVPVSKERLIKAIIKKLQKTDNMTKLAGCYNLLTECNCHVVDSDPWQNTASCNIDDVMLGLEEHELVDQSKT